MFESYNPYNPYSSYGSYNSYNPYYSQPLSKTNQPVYRQQMGLQGKVVDSLEVVKATDIPYDGSISYFPLTDGSAVITKQLQQDGTSRVIIYRPVDLNTDTNTNNVTENKPKYVTETDLKEQLRDMDDKYITENDLEKQLKDIDKKFITNDDLEKQLKSVNNKDLKDLKEDIKTLKRKLEDITDDLKYKKEK